MALIDTTGIRPIERRQPTEDLSRARRREEGTSSAFRPQTNVALKTAIQDLSATLSKISSEEKYGVQKLPKEVSDVVKNILQQSLSMEATLNKGIGSTIESQRFSMDQLMLFSRMLTQMGTLAERGYSMKVSDVTQLLMANLKNVVVAEASGEELEPVLMTKSAFELVDAKLAEQLPQALYEILAQLANTPAAVQQQQPQSEGMQFLKQLVRYFIPRPEVDVPAQEREQKILLAQQQQEAQNQQGQQARAPSASAQEFLNSMFKNFGGRFSQQAQNQPQGQQVPINQQNQPQGQQAPINQQNQTPAQFNQVPINQQNQPQSQQVPINQQNQTSAQFNQVPINQQNQPQGQQVPINQQNQPPAQFNQVPINQQNQPQGQQVPINQQNQSPAQSQQAPINQQNQPSAQFNQVPTNQQNQPQGQQAPINQQNQSPAQFNQVPTNQQNQSQSQQAPINQQNQSPAQFNQVPTNQQNQAPAQFNQAPINQQNQSQSQQAPINQQNQPQGQQVPINQQNQPPAQGQQVPINQQNQTQGQQVPTNQQNQPQGQQVPTNQQNQPQGQQVPINQQNQPPAQFNQAPINQQNQPPAQFNQAPINQQNQPPAQGQQVPTNQQNQPSAQFNQVPINQQNQTSAQGQQVPINQQNQTPAQGQQVPINQQNQTSAQFNQAPINQQNQPQGKAQPQSQQTQAQMQPEIPVATFPLNRAFVSRQRDMRRHMELAKNDLIKTQLQNTPQTIGTMRNLALFLTQDANSNLNPRETALLRNFLNSSQQTMSETEARHLQNLLRLCQQNIPLTVRQAAVQQNLPDLPRLWAFMQMCDMAGIASKMNNPKSFKRAGKDVAAFATAMRSAMSSDNAVVQNQRAFQMMIPLYMGDNETSYPTYFNIYDENNPDPDTGENKKETWVRICLLTDNIGAAELVFRIYEETHLDMRFYFTQSEIAKEFGDIYVNQLKHYMKNVSLEVGEISVGSVGEGLFSY